MDTADRTKPLVGGRQPLGGALSSSGDTRDHPGLDVALALLTYVPFMRDRETATRVGVEASDVVVAGLLMGLGLWNVWFAWEQFFPGSSPHLAINTATTLIATGALVFRRRAPVLVLVATSAALFVPDLVVATGPVFFGEWIPFLVAAYSAASLGSGWSDSLSVSVGIASYTVFVWRYPSDFREAAAVLAWLGPLLIVVSVGHLIRGLRERSQQLAQHAEELERTRGLEADRAVADERARIARELHDVIAHNVSIMVVQAGAAENVLRDNEVARAALRHVQAAGRETLDEMRLLLGVLRPDDVMGTRSPAPSLRRLETLIEPLEQAGMVIELTITGTEHRVPSSVDISAYRIVQEALTNSLKHAPGAPVTVRIDIGPTRVVIEVRDRGCDAPAPNGHGFGLAGLRERVELLGGRLNAAADPDGGFAVRAELPTEVTA